MSDFLGCTVFFETMATWCSNCLAQLNTVAEAVPQLDPDRHIVIAISVETELSAEDLANYADTNEFGWLFTVADADEEDGRGHRMQ
ncbi:MAG: hypothetical protein WKF81_03710 [Thermomicrobiales bacterium]